MKILLIIFFLSWNKTYSQSQDSLKNSIDLQYDYQHFKKSTNDWHIIGLGYTKKTKGGTYAGRFKYANRFNQNGLQSEVEAYSILSKKVYAYTNISYSADVPVFAKWRTGASLFINLSKGWEAEGGVRFLYFDKPIFIATAGLSKYFNSWLFNFRSFVPLNNGFHEPSIFVSARKYFKNEKDFGWIQTGSGVSPDETRNVQFINNASFSSKIILGGLRKTVYHNLVGLVSMGFSKDEIAQDDYDNRFYGTIGLQQYF